MAQEITWAEVERGSAAVSAWQFEGSFAIGMNPEDVDELVRAVLYWSRTDANPEEVYQGALVSCVRSSWCKS
jgi:hypothetical protein